MSNWKKGDKLIAIDNDRTALGTKIIKGQYYTFSGYYTCDVFTKCYCCGHSGGFRVMVEETGDSQWAPCCTFKKVEPRHIHSTRSIKHLSVLKELARMPITIETLETQKQEA